MLKAVSCCYCRMLIKPAAQKAQIMMTCGPMWGQNCGRQTKSLFTFDFKIATPNASHYLSIKSSRATHSFSNCAGAELIWTRMYWHWHQCWKLKLSKSSIAVSFFTLSPFFFFLNIHVSSSYPTHINIISKCNRSFNTINLFSILHKFSKSL